MARPNPLRELMYTPLPSLSKQKRKPFRPSIRTVYKTYNLINKYVFNNQLVRPPIEIGICRKYWGICIGEQFQTRPGTYSRIRIMDKYFCVQWFVTTLAHEMVHQYEWDIQRKDMTHRQSFFAWREQLAKYEIDLKTSHGQKRWFKHQDFKKC